MKNLNYYVKCSMFIVHKDESFNTFVVHYFFGNE